MVMFDCACSKVLEKFFMVTVFSGEGCFTCWCQACFWCPLLDQLGRLLGWEKWLLWDSHLRQACTFTSDFSLCKVSDRKSTFIALWSLSWQKQLPCSMQLFRFCFHLISSFQPLLYHFYYSRNFPWFLL
jgi:hypothetical protein